jgi:hypothetical protein
MVSDSLNETLSCLLAPTDEHQPRIGHDVVGEHHSDAHVAKANGAHFDLPLPAPAARNECREHAGVVCSNASAHRVQDSRARLLYRFKQIEVDGDLQ